jgi:hypothetical protein
VTRGAPLFLFARALVAPYILCHRPGRALEARAAPRAPQRPPRRARRPKQRARAPRPGRRRRRGRGTLDASTAGARSRAPARAGRVGAARAPEGGARRAEPPPRPPRGEGRRAPASPTGRPEGAPLDARREGRAARPRAAGAPARAPRAPPRRRRRSPVSFEAPKSARRERARARELVDARNDAHWSPPHARGATGTHATPPPSSPCPPRPHSPWRSTSTTKPS